MTEHYRSKFRIDEPTPNRGVVISRDILQAAINEYMQGPALLGMLEDESHASLHELVLDRVSHIVKDVNIDADGYLCAALKFIETTYGS